VIAEVPEKNLSLLKLGAPARIKVAAYPEAPFTGRIARIGEMLNPETRTVEARCLVDNRYGKLKPEMFATISLAIGDKRTALMVNQAALQEMDEQTVVFIARADNQFEKRAIKTGRRQGDLVEVVEGLSRGERVVTEGSFQIKSEFSKDKLADEK
ncbi:MAG: efflux RND transporter periplasmic adaptor subunit, partial [Acidobacteriota bacterium]|nr:efflux RND transporter periplasmic adaptor subunit [Acidobacteriota bacterium]